MPPPWLWVTIRHQGQRPSLPFRSDEEAVKEQEGGGGSGEKDQREGERQQEWKEGMREIGFGGFIRYFEKI
jgi:hypothetical protein